MGRRKDHTREELKELAISESYAIVEKLGYKALSVRKLAAKMGYTPGTLYNVFVNFDELMLHVNSRILEQLEGFLQQALKRKKAQSDAKIKGLAQAYIKFSVEREKLWSSLFEHSASLDFEIPDWYQARLKQIFSVAEEWLVELMGGGSRSQIQSASRILWAGVHGIAMLSSHNKLQITRSQNAQKLCSDFVDNYLRGLKRKTQS